MSNVKKGFAIGTVIFALVMLLSAGMIYAQGDGCDGTDCRPTRTPRPTKTRAPTETPIPTGTPSTDSTATPTPTGTIPTGIELVKIEASSGEGFKEVLLVFVRFGIVSLAVVIGYLLGRGQKDG